MLKFIMAAVMACLPLLAVTDQTFSFAGTSATVTNSQHGLNSKYYAIMLFDSGGTLMQPNGSPGYTYSIHPTTYALTVNLGASTSGTIVIRGAFTGVTNHSRDFAPSIGIDGSGGFFKVCADCTLSNFALRSWGGKTYGAGGPSRLSLASSGGGGHVRVWLEGNKVVYGYSYSWVGGDACTSSCELRSSVSAFPYGVVKIGEADRGNTVGTYWIESSFTDLRSSN